MNTLTQDRLRTMLTLQDQMNRKVNPDWQTAGYAFLRAAAIEAGEALEHYGWKWWKKQQPDVAQLKIELIDIWHFYLSDMVLLAQGNLHDAAAYYMNMLHPNAYGRNSVTFDGRVYVFADLDLRRKLDVLMGMACGRRQSVALFASIMEDLEMSWDELYRGYIGKNVLNFFRQDHGYKDGSYVKMWPGLHGDDLVEDNVHLEAILQQHDDPAAIYNALKEVYMSKVLA